MRTTVAPFVLDAPFSPFHAQHLTPRELRHFHHGHFLMDGVAGDYRGAPQFRWTCLACRCARRADGRWINLRTLRHVRARAGWVTETGVRERVCVRTAASLFASGETSCGCEPATPLVGLRFGELVVRALATAGAGAYECVCLCGRRGLNAESRGRRVLVTERALRDGSAWACLSCMVRRLAAEPRVAA